MKFFISTCIFLSFTSYNLFAQDYKQMMEDKTVNFYDVVAAAESYFSGIDTSKKGSGYKQFQHWVYENEQRYYPSGNRQNIDPYFAENEFKRINSSQSAQRMAGETWENLGPFVVDNISGNYNAGLGRVEDFWVNPTNQNQIILSSRSGGLWKTADAGTTWEGNLTDGLIATGVNTFTVNPANSNDIIVNVRNGKNGTSHGLYRSTNGGTNWIETNFNPTNLGAGGLGSDFEINDVKFHPTSANTIFIATDQGIYRSINDLTSWTQLYAADTIDQVEFHPTNANVVYFLKRFEGNRIYRSTNGGASYSSFTVTGNNATGELSVSQDCADCVYIGSSDGVFKSTNQGTSWSMAGAAPAGMYGGFAVSDADDNYMIFGSLNNFRSVNGGASFSISNAWSLGSHGSGTNLENFNNSDSYIHADNRKTRSINGTFYVATDGFLSRSSDFGVTWEILSQGICIRENYKLGASQSNADRFICGSQDNGTTIKNENGFIEMYGADGMEGIVHPLNDDWMIGSVQNGTRIRTQDGGINYGGVSPNNEGGVWEAPILVDPFNQMRVLHMSDEVHVSENFGSTWSLKGDPNMAFKITQAEFSYSQEDLLLVSSYEELKKSIDGGVTFSSIDTGLPFSTISDIAIHPENSDVFVVTYTSYEDNNQKIYITTNGGNSWTNITHNLGNMPIHTAVIDWDSNSRIYVGAEIGVYTKLMSENSWTLYNGNLPNVSVEELEITRGSNMLTAATWGRGLWEIPLLDKSNHPAIRNTEVTVMPTANPPVSSTPQTVTSTIEYNGNLTEVKVVYSINNQLFDTEIPMSNTAGDIWESDAPIPDDQADAYVYFKVIATGDNGTTSQTYQFMYQNHTYSVCDGLGIEDTNANDYIYSTKIGSTITNSGQDLYTYYDANPIELAAGGSYDIEIQLAGVFNGDAAYAWLDWNKNGVFDAEEEVTMSAYSSTWLSTGTLTIPLDVVRDQVVVMRLRNTYNSADPCGTAYGEVEDYAIIIKEPCFDKPLTVWNGGWSNGLPSEMLNVEFTSNYVTNGVAIEACSCAISNNAEVTINGGDYLKAVSNINIELGSKLNVSHQASVVQVDDKAIVTNNGTVNVNITTPFLKPRDFIISGSPMTTETRGGVHSASFRVLEHSTLDFFPHPLVDDFYAPNVVANFMDDNFNDWLTYSGTIHPAEGYLVYPQASLQDGNSTYDLTFTQGTLTNGVVTYALDYHVDKNSSPNIISNPYASAIDAELFISANPEIDEVYFWEHITTPNNTFPGGSSANFSMEDISMYNLSGGIGAGTAATNGGVIPNGIISTSQGFGVKATAAGTATFNNAMRVTTGNTTLRTPVADRNRIWLEIKSLEYELSSETLIAFSPAATSAFDAGYDSDQIGSIISLYSHLPDGNMSLGIQGREAFNEDIQIPMGCASQINDGAVFEISIKNLEGIELENANVYLVDTFEDIIVNLSESGVYTFTTEKGNFPNRFILQFKTENILNNPEQELAQISVTPNPTNGVLYINSPNSIIKNIHIVDMQGRVVERINNIEAMTSTIHISELQNAVYFITVETEKGSIIKRVIKK